MGVAHIVLVRFSAYLMNRTRHAIALVLFSSIALLAVSMSVSDTCRYFVSALVSAFVYRVPTDADRSQAELLRSEVVRIHHFRRLSASMPSEPPVFCSPGSKGLLTLPATLWVYDVRDRAEQDRIDSALRNLIVRNAAGPCKVYYYDHENWLVDGNMGSRGAETQLRCVRIASSGVKEISGRKIIPARG